jgi:AbiTii
MNALVPELVNMASDPAVSASDLLRRALVVARRLDVPDLVVWINGELNGYVTGDVPNYRMLTGQLKAMNPIRGPIPLMLPSAALTERYTRADVRQSVPELLELAKSTTGVFCYFTARAEHELMQAMEIPMRPAISLSTVQIHGIVEKVRSRVLDWALDLEGRGVFGEGMTFTQAEKQTVQGQHYHFGNVSGSQIQISSPASTQMQTDSTGLDLEALKGLVEALGSLVARGDLDGIVGAELRAELATLKAQAESPKPKWDVIKATARSIKAIAEGAAGSLLSELAKPHVATLLALAATAI